MPGGASGAKVVPAVSPPSPAPTTLVPPSLKTYAEPVYPPERLAKGEKASVVVELTIDATGTVTAAKVTTAAGADFDASALEASSRLVFNPATRDGKPIPSKIPFKFNFDFKEVASPATESESAKQARKPVIALSGQVKTVGDEPIGGASVTVTSRLGAISSTTTNAEGAFAVADLPPGKYQVRVEASGFNPYVVEEEVVKGSVTEVTYRPSALGDTVEILVKGERPPREVTRRVLDMKEVMRIPGTNGDALRSLQSLPGVARPPGFAGLLIIRGSAPQDTNVFVDGTLIPLVYHFGGLSSVVPSEFLDRIDFYPGNFGPDFGRVMGGIVDVGIRSPKKDAFHGLLQFDLIDGRIVAEGPIDSKTRFAIAGRRSWVDAWLGPTLKKAGTGVSTAPRYYDYQVMVERDLTDSTTARLLLFGADDKLALTLNSPSSSDPAIGGDLRAHTGFLRLQGRLDTRVGRDVKWTNTIAAGYDNLDFAVEDYFFKLRSQPISWRSDVRAKLSKDASLIVGMDFLLTHYLAEVNFPPVPTTGEVAGPFFARPPVHLVGDGLIWHPAVYAMLDLQPTKGLKLLPGVRLDYGSETDRANLSPRFATRYDLLPDYPRTTFKGGVGIFQQPPLPNQALPPFGTPHLRESRAVHYDLGFEQELTRAVEVSLEGFYKDLSDLVAVKAAATGSANGVVYTNDGTGRVFGAELLLRYKPDSRFFGWLAYTLSRSERRDGPGLPIHGYQFDQTHIFTVLGSYQLGRGWEAGARFRYVSGSLYTPFVGGVMDFDAGAYAPVQSSALFSARNAAFHQLDVRIDKTFRFANWRLGLYLDVQNVYNRQNPEGIAYNYNYSQSTVVSGIPILPVIGIRGEL
ncbi:MAG: TonB-dependent receptor [Polyangiales bacterium]